MTLAQIQTHTPTKRRSLHIIYIYALSKAATIVQKIKNSQSEERSNDNFIDKKYFFHEPNEFREDKRKSNKMNWHQRETNISGFWQISCCCANSA